MLRIAMLSHPNDRVKGEALLTSRFRDPERRLFFAKALLFPNRIEFSGLTLSGMYRRLLLLENIEQVEWKAGQAKTANLTLWLRDGGKFRVWVHTAGLWKYMIEANVRTLSRQLPQSAGPTINWGPET